MAIRYVAPIGTASGNGDGTTEANAFNGLEDARAKMGSHLSAGDTLKAVITNGPFGLGELIGAAVWASSNMMPSLTISGCKLGNDPGLASNASGKTIDLRGAVFDFRGGGSSQRHSSLLTIMGEDITVLTDGVQFHAGNYAYSLLFTPAQVGSLFIEDAGWENMCLTLNGWGITVENEGTGVFSGSNGWSKVAVCFMAPESGVGGVSSSKTTTFRGLRCNGSHYGFVMTPTGVGGSDYPYAAKMLNTGMISHTPVFGRNPGDPIKAYGAAIHGGCISILGKGFGRAIVENFLAYGECQDLAECVSGGTQFRDGVLRDSQTVNPETWFNSGGSWTRGVQVGIHGGGLKLGLPDASGASPSSWMGTDGVVGGYFNIDQETNIALRLRIERVSGTGITTNGSKGAFIHACELYEIGGDGVSLAPASTRALTWVSHTRCRLAANSNGAGALAVYGNVKPHLYNNVWHGGNRPDVSWSTGETPLKSQNKLINGTFVGSYPTTGDRSGGDTAWTDGQGPPAGSSLLSGGSLAPYQTARTVGVTRDVNGVRFDTLNPPLGPFSGSAGAPAPPPPSGTSITPGTALYGAADVGMPTPVLTSTNAGNLVTGQAAIALVGWWNGADTGDTFEDVAGNTWTALTKKVSSDLSQQARIYYCLNCTGHSSEIGTLRLPGSTADYRRVLVLMASYGGGTLQIDNELIDGAAGKDAASANTLTGVVTPTGTDKNLIVYVAIAWDGGTFSDDGTCTPFAPTQTDYIAAGWRVQTGTAPVTLGVDYTSTTKLTMCAACFKLT